MKKFLLTALTLGCVATLSWAVPAKRGAHTFTQSDGSTIVLQPVGDEFLHCFITADGLTVQRGDDGDFYYRTPDGRTEVRAHEAALRQGDEQAFVTANAAVMNMAALSTDEVQRQRSSRAPRRASGDPQVPNVGSPRIPVILVQYKDVKFKDDDPKETFDDFFHLEGGVSAYQYFYDQSNGKYQPQFDVYGPFTLPSNRATYGGNNYWGNDKGVGKMVGQAVEGMDDEIDFSLYDNNGDGKCDVVIVLYAGVGEADSYVSDSVWPCQWSLGSSDFGHNLSCDGVTVSKFAVFNELLGMDPSRIDGVGTVCHEFSHCLGLPDYYETTYQNGYFGMGDWSLMDHGCYADDGYTPVGYSAYDKHFLGWIDLAKPEESTFYTLPALNQKSEETDVALQLVNAADPNECYVLENRQQQGWDEFLPASGLLVNHVTYSPSAWSSNTVNNYMPQRMTIIPADNSLKNPWADQMGDPYPYNGNDELTNTSTPAARVNKGTYMNQPITEISRNNDGTVSFWYMRAEGPFLHAPKLAEESEVTTDGFTAEWGAIEGADRYTLQVWPTANALEVRTIEDIVEPRCTVDGLASNTAYTYKVKAVNDEVESKWSDTRTVTTNIIYTAELTADPEAIDLGEVVLRQTGEATFVLRGEGVTDAVSLTLHDDSGFFALSAQSLDAAAVADGVEVTVAFVPTELGEYEASVTIATEGARDITLSLSAVAIDDPELDDPVMLEPQDVESTAFTAVWTDESVEERVASYTLHLLRIKWPDDPNAGQLLDEEDFTTRDGITWDITDTGANYDRTLGCLVLGSSPNMGSITSPVFVTTNSPFSIVVRAAAYNDMNGAKLIAELDKDDGAVLETQSLDIKPDGYNYYVFAFNAEPGSHTVTLFNGASSRRVCITDVKIFDGPAPAEYTHVPTGDDATAERTIEGIADKYCRVTDLMAGATYEYKVQGVYTDGTLSEWSNLVEVTLTEAQYQLGDVNGDGIVDIQDVTDLLDVVLGNISASSLRGDCHVAGNETVDVTDVTMLIDIVLGSTSAE